MSEVVIVNDALRSLASIELDTAEDADIVAFASSLDKVEGIKDVRRGDILEPYVQLRIQRGFSWDGIEDEVCNILVKALGHPVKIMTEASVLAAA